MVIKITGENNTQAADCKLVFIAEADLNIGICIGQIYAVAGVLSSVIETATLSERGGGRK